MLLLALSIATLQDPTISIRAGYYTVNELAAAFRQQQVQVNVVNSGNDVYAVRFDKRPWKDVRAALIADERLVIGQKNGVWQIERSILDKNGEALALKRYVDFARRTIFNVFSRAADFIRRAESTVSEAERNRAYGGRPTFDKDDPVQNGINQLIYLIGASRDMPFFLVTGPAALSDPTNPVPFGRFSSDTLWDAGHMLAPTGDLTKMRLPFQGWQNMSDAEKERLARTIQFGAKLAIDPLTLNVSTRTSLVLPPQAGMFLGLSPPRGIAPRFTQIVPQRADVWTPTPLEAHQLRASRTVLALHKMRGREVELPARPLRPSEALLWVAEKADSDVLFHVGAFTDVPLVMPPKADLAYLISNLNTGLYDSDFIHRSVFERVDSNLEVAKQPPFKPLIRLSAEQVGGVTVVRDERRFLDGMSVSPPGLPTALENTRFRGGKLALEDVARHVGGLSVVSWPTSIFSSNYLHTCNPVTFYPFARLLLASAKLRQGVLRKGGFDIRFSDLEPAAQTAFSRSLMDARLLNDAIPNGQLDSVLAPAMIKPTSNIIVVVQDWGYEFRLFDDQSGHFLWSSWVRL